MTAQPKIMVVDDERGICSNVAKILKKNNYEVTETVSAKEALDKMAQESYALLISDIVMPEMNGLELLKLVKNQWPLTKAVMMTAYASTDTAVKAIRLGALDYIPKPFTPDELRTTVENALAGNLVEAEITTDEREAINIIDVDIPFDADEVAAATSEAYADSLGPSDMPVIEIKSLEPLEGFCEVGDMVCDIFKKLGATCKAGVKTTKCPQLAKKKRAAKKKGGQDPKTLVGIDMPFEYNEVVAVTGPEYVHNLQSEGISVPYYEDLKANVAAMMDRMEEADKTRQEAPKPINVIDADIPFDADEVAAATSEAYADSLGPSDMPVVEIEASQPLEGFCEMGDMVCDIFKKLGATCKAGVKTAKCPQLAKKKRAAKKRAGVDPKTLIGIDMPFDYEEVAAATGETYAGHMLSEGVVQVPYEELKQNVAAMLATAEEQAAAGAKIHEFPSESVSRDILVVDDEVAVNNNIRKILAKKGFGVDQAFTKEEALASLESRAYTLVLLDLRIPGVKGLELLAAIREKRPATKVIMITGYASIETAVEAARMGVVEYLPKPFTPQEIRSATERAVQLAA